MIWEKINERLIYLGIDADCPEQIFELLGGELVKEGYCKDSFIEALTEREKEYPTGIRMGEIGIALPHTDSVHVNCRGLAIGVLKKPVVFYEMGSQNTKVNTKIVFVLAVDDPKEHLQYLQRILQILQDSSVLRAIETVKEKEQLIKIIKEKEQNI